MPKGEELVLSSSPHIHVKENVRSIMIKVLVALLPAMIASIWFFGLAALRVLVLTTVFAIAAEAIWCKLSGKSWKTILDGSAALTGVLLALNFSAGMPWWICLIGAFIAIWLGKQVFGGLGHNPFNPALVARVALLIGFPAFMTSWVPASNMTPENSSYSQVFYAPDDFAALQNGEIGLDAVSCATPLGIVGETKKILGNSPEAQNNFTKVDNPAALKNYFFGNVGGCMGETSSLALLIGGALLIFWRLIKWQIPVFYIGTVAIFTAILHYFMPGVTPSPLFHLLTGGLLLGSIFMATDMVTSPMSGLGCIIFGVGLGILTCVIRIWGNYPEGVSFAILLMNALVPLIDRVGAIRPFGYVRRKAA